MAISREPPIITGASPGSDDDRRFPPPATAEPTTGVPYPTRTFPPRSFLLSARRLLDRLPLLDDRRHALLTGLLLTLLALTVALQWAQQRLDLAMWDFLLLSGLVVLIVGLRLAAGIPPRLHETLRRLVDRGSLRLNEGALTELWQRVERQADFWARLVGVLAVAAIFLAFRSSKPQELLLMLFEMAAAYVVGMHLGRFVGYGQLGGLLRTMGIRLHAEPEHVDGVGGLKPIGDFYFHQAMVVAVPAAFLAVWWFLFPLWPRDYSYWRDSYLALLSFAIAVEVLSFLLPLWSFHTAMAQEKRAWQREGDAISGQIERLQREMEEASATGMADLRGRIDQLGRRYAAIESMATWPVDGQIRRRFRVNNLLLLVPVVGDFVTGTVSWERMSEVMQRFVS